MGIIFQDTPDARSGEELYEGLFDTVLAFYTFGLASIKCECLRLRAYYEGLSGECSYGFSGFLYRRYFSSPLEYNENGGAKVK